MDEIMNLELRTQTPIVSSIVLLEMRHMGGKKFGRDIVLHTRPEELADLDRVDKILRVSALCVVDEIDAVSHSNLLNHFADLIREVLQRRHG
jgi:hypothetical protein